MMRRQSSSTATRHSLTHRDLTGGHPRSDDPSGQHLLPLEVEVIGVVPHHQVVVGVDHTGNVEWLARLKVDLFPWNRG